MLQTKASFRFVKNDNNWQEKDRTEITKIYTYKLMNNQNEIGTEERRRRQKKNVRHQIIIILLKNNKYQEKKERTEITNYILTF